jgi:hypothetical protein
MSLPLWRQPAPVEEINVEEIPMVSLTQEEAEGVAQVTREKLSSQGYCLWTCRALRNETIVIVRDKTVGHYPDGYPVYTLEEIELLDDLDVKQMRLINHAKKLGCTLISVERKENKVEKL